MADIISRIVLQAQGGDQVAAEYRKITKAASEAARASQGIGTGGGAAAIGGGDWSAFMKATGNEAGSHTAAREARNADYGQRLRSREQQHQSLQSQNQSVSRGLFQTVNQLSGAVGQAAGGDVVGGAGGALTSLASKMGPWGIALAAVVGAGMAVNKLANTELERMGQLWGGVGQRLKEGDFYGFQKKTLELQGKGFVNTLPFMQALAGAGGRALTAAEADNLIRFQYNTGMDIGTLAQTTALFQQAGAGTSLVTSQGFRGQAENAFGRGQMGLFYQTISSAIEGAMERGFTKGSDAFTGAYTSMIQRLADFATAGRLTPQGAVAAFQTVQKAVAGAAAGPKRPEDVMQFMMFRKPGESYIDTIKRQTEPGSELAMYQNLKSLSGGNRDALTEMVMRTFGFTDYRQAQAYIAASESRLDLIAHPRPLVGAGGKVLPETPDEVLRRQGLKAQRTNVLERWGITKAAGGVAAWFTELLGGRVEDPVTQENRQIWQAAFDKNSIKGFGTSYGAMTTMVQGGGTGFLKTLPATMQKFASYYLSEEGYGATMMPRAGSPIFESLLPLMGMYTQYAAGKTAGMSPAELAMMKKYSPIFKVAAESFGELGAGAASFQGVQAITDAIYRANDENRDNMKDITIVDILRAIEMLLEQGTLTDTGTTEAP